jgi:two-component system chemotaxis response regulator CheY
MGIAGRALLRAERFVAGARRKCAVRGAFPLRCAAMARILVVEDSSAFRAFIRAALESAPEIFGSCAAEDVDVVEAASGFDALRLLPRGQYDLVITDINMPDINGLELVRFMRENERYRQVCTIIISTQSSEKDRARGLALGADAFLAKPFTAETLRHTIAANLRASVPVPSSSVDHVEPAADREGSRP